LVKNENYLYKNIWQLSWLERDFGRNHHHNDIRVIPITAIYVYNLHQNEIYNVLVILVK
jgi:hypothetical protein